jgi:hypothetical protein
VSIAGSATSPARTNAAGVYKLQSIPVGAHTVTVVPVCKPAASKAVVVDGTEQVDVTVQEQNTADAFGYACRRSGSEVFTGVTPTGLTGDDAAVSVALPFSFPFYGTPRTSAFVSTNGFISFSGPSSAFANTAIPDAAGPNAAIYAFWDDLVVDGSAQVATTLTGQAPFRQFIIRWSQARLHDLGPQDRVTFEILLSEDGAIDIRYEDIDAGATEEGGSATMGIEDDAGTSAVQEGFNVRHLRVGVSASGLRFEPNRVPDANAPGLAVLAAPGAKVPLDGTRSFDPDGGVLRFLWRQISGPTTPIAEPTANLTSITAPKTVGANCTYQLHVVDEYGASSDVFAFVTVKAPK